MNFLGSKAGGFAPPSPPFLPFGRHHNDDDSGPGGHVGPHIVGDFGWGGTKALFDGFDDCFRFGGNDHGHHDLPPTQLNATLDPTALTSHGTILSGSGTPGSGSWSLTTAATPSLPKTRPIGRSSTA